MKPFIRLACLALCAGLLLAASACSPQDSSQASTVSESSVESEATPTPEPTTPPADVTYTAGWTRTLSLLGSGTTEDPYVFLCTEDCVMTREFLLRLLGDGSGATPSPEDVLTTPFAAVFEVREDNSNYGDLLYSFTLDGTQLSGSFQVSDAITGSNTLESVMEVFDAPPAAPPLRPHPTPTTTTTWVTPARSSTT